MTYLADGVQSNYRYGFKINDADQLRVLVIDPLDLEIFPLYLGEDYLVEGVGQDEGGRIELTEAGIGKATPGFKLVIKAGAAYKLTKISGAFQHEP